MRICALLLWLAAPVVVSGAAAAQDAPSQISTFKVDINFYDKFQRKPVPFESVAGIVVFTMKVEGREVSAMLDNGSGDSLIDTAFAGELGLKLGRKVGDARTSVGTMDRYRIEKVSIDIPGQAHFTAPVSAVDLSAFSKMVGRKISFVVGREYFSNLTFVIQPSVKTFQIGPSGTLPMAPGTKFVPLIGTRPQVAVSIDGKPATVSIDMGFSDPLALNDAAWDRIGLRGTFGTRGGVSADGRPYAITTGTADEVTIGPLRQTDVTISREPIVPAAGDGILGLGWLGRYDFVLDVKAGKLWIIGPATPK